MSYIQIRNFAKFQHYKHRKPPWIRLYNSILRDRRFQKLDDKSKWLCVGLFILASQYENKIDFDEEWIIKELSLTEKPDWVSLKKSKFIKFINASKTLADCKQNSFQSITDNTDTDNSDNTDTDIRVRDNGHRNTEKFFNAFWVAYPRKEAKQPAYKSFWKINPSEQLLKLMIDWLEMAKESEQWQDANKIPHPATWLNQHRWEGNPPPKPKEPERRSSLFDEDNGNEE